MELEKEQHIYSVEYIYNVFNMGLSSAIFVLEKSLVLTVDERMHMLEALRWVIKTKNE